MCLLLLLWHVKECINTEDIIIIYPGNWMGYLLHGLLKRFSLTTNSPALESVRITTYQRKKSYDKVMSSKLTSKCIVTGQSLHSQDYSNQPTWSHVQSDRNYSSSLAGKDRNASASFSCRPPSSGLQTKICSLFFPMTDIFLGFYLEVRALNKQQHLLTLIKRMMLSLCLLKRNPFLCAMLPLSHSSLSPHQ